MASLSEKLRRERELRGISLKQISEDTKIGVRFLEALEQDRLELIPGEFYRRSYLRAYAKYLGLDEERAVNAYAFANQEKPPTSDTPDADGALAGKSSLGWVALVLGVLGILALFYWFPAAETNSSPSGGTETASPRVSETTTVEPTPVSDPEPPSSSLPAGGVPSLVSPPPVSVADGALRLRVVVEESCWLEIRGDGEVLTIGLKESGFQSVFAADSELRLWLGNAGGVSMWLNERPLRALGSDGQVRKDVVVTPENYMDFLASEADSP